jgi:hypothetical protein
VNYECDGCGLRFAADLDRLRMLQSAEAAALTAKIAGALGEG